MLESLARVTPDEAPQSVTVYWGGRTPSDLYIDVQSMATGHQYVPVLSRAAADWTGATGYVQDAFRASNPDLSRAVVYACGSDAMIRSAKANLLAAGLPETRFFSDSFVPSAP
jgi:CDP-4-dehydro-6-deoxyglucose reductase